MMISVIMPCYMAESTLKASIQSVLDQKGVELELLVMDGGSTDGSIGIIEEFKNDRRIRWRSEPDRGVYDAINKGLRLASGEWLAILNANDRYFSGVLADVLLYASETNKKWICGPVRTVDPNGKKSSVIVSPIAPEKWLVKGLQQMPTPHVGFFMHKRVLDQCGQYSLDYSIAADHEYMIRVASQSTFAGMRIHTLIAEVDQGGMSGGFQGRWEHLRVARLYGRPLLIALIVFLIQTMKAVVFKFLPAKFFRILRVQTRFEKQALK